MNLNFKKTNEDDDENLKSFDEFIGHEDVIEILKVSIEAAKRTETVLDHILFVGPPGMGKTTLARLTAKEMGVKIIERIGSDFARQSDAIEKIRIVMSNLKDGEILFIDEIHRMDRAAQEVLYEPIQSRTMRPDDSEVHERKNFTLIGATTEQGQLLKPLMNRLNKIHVSIYNIEAVEKIASAAAKRRKMIIDDIRDITKIAQVSRQSPRVVNRNLRRIKNYVISKNPDYDFRNLSSHDKYKMLALHWHPDMNNSPDAEEMFKKIDIMYKFSPESPDVDQALLKMCLSIPIRISCIDIDKTLELWKIDENGLEELDRRYLDFLAENWTIPVGLNRIATALFESELSIKNDVEPWLYHMKFIDYTPKGRMLKSSALRMKKYGLEEKVREYHGGIIPPRKGMEVKQQRGFTGNRNGNDDILDDIGDLPVDHEDIRRIRLR